MSSNALVLLTGGNGFAGAHVLEQLLARGYRVRAAVRSSAKAAFMQRKHAEHTTSGALSFAIVPDLAAPHALDESMSDADYVIHLASPYFFAKTDPVAELIDPAINATRSVLASALQAKHLRRVTTLSSFAAITNPLIPGQRPGHVYSEADWNPTTLEDVEKNAGLGYLASKVLAERAAWDVWEKEKPAWDLVTVNPPMIYGPAVHEVDASKGIAGLNTSLQTFANALTGKDPASAPNVSAPRLPAWVDVRDVAGALVKTLELPKGVSERFLICSGLDFFEDGLVGLRERGEEGLGGKGPTINRAEWFSVNTAKAKSVLGMEYIGIQKTTEDTWANLKGLGVVGK